MIQQVRILVTHSVRFLSQCDKIIVMDKGRISEVGSYEELIDHSGAFSEFLQNYGKIESDSGMQGKVIIYCLLIMKAYRKSQ